MPIRRLPTLLVNQIAAGEVVERPVSVVKELVENSIDAGATRIEIAIEQGGRELIRITDNGGGIPSDELDLALAAHATSKIQQAEDLDAIATMGFRGEALASIASVSRIAIQSRTPEAQSASLIEGEGDQINAVRPAAGSPGTVVTVRNLFFNTPARRRFLRTDRAETGRVSDLVESLALAHPAIAFRFTADARTRLELDATDDAHRRILDVLGHDLQGELVPCDVRDRGVHLSGMLGRPGIARATTRHMRVFLNGRVITDRTINHAIREGYRGLIDPTRHPTVVLFIAMDPAQVDVNVHPAKAEVRFRNQNTIHGVVLRAVRDSLARADLAPVMSLDGLAHETAALPPMPAPEFGSGTSSSQPSQFVEYFKRLEPTQKGFVYEEMRSALAREHPDVVAAVDAGVEARTITPVPDPNDAPDALPSIRRITDAMQVHSSFIVTQDAQGLLIIDQHALHERVMFQHLLDRIGQGNLEAQRLLMPAVVEADQQQMEQLEALQPLLERLGIEAEPIGPRSIAVHSFTSLLFARNVDPVSFMTELLSMDLPDDAAQSTEAALHEVLDMMACKAAIKAGETLSDTELANLLQQRESVERSSNCPHGRPTSLRLSIEMLEKQFGRR
jgi:DNA mismatch repair protein MutL